MPNRTQQSPTPADAHSRSTLAEQQLDAILLRTAIGLVKGISVALEEWLRTVEPLQTPPFEGIIDFNELVKRFEIGLIRAALITTGSNQTRAAQLLGIKLTTLNSKISRFQIDIRNLRGTTETFPLEYQPAASGEE